MHSYPHDKDGPQCTEAVDGDGNSDSDGDKEEKKRKKPKEIKSR